MSGLYFAEPRQDQTGLRPDNLPLAVILFSFLSAFTLTLIIQAALNLQTNNLGNFFRNDTFLLGM